MKDFLLVGAGGALGAAARYGTTLALARWGSSWPLGTFSVNLLGSFLIGILAGMAAGRVAQPTLVLLLGTGFLGGFTTLSAVSLETVAMLERGRAVQALGYGFGTMALATLAAFAGLWAVRQAS